jgi:mRNA-degrading endonuclease HigB of HigAB toxin-antitoxin module
MEEILETILLESEKSTFLVDLIKYNDHQLYVQIIQTTHSEYKESTQHRIKINPRLLTDIISVLQTYKMSIEKAKYAPSFLIKNSIPRISDNRFVSETDAQEIQNRYLKGINLQDLAIQFNTKVLFIKQILRSRGIEICDFKLPKFYLRTRFRFRKRK